MSSLVSCFLYEDSICVTPIFEPTKHKLVVYFANFNLDGYCLIQYSVQKKRWEGELRLQYTIWSDNTILQPRTKYPRRRHLLYLKCSPQVRINPELFIGRTHIAWSPSHVFWLERSMEWLLHVELKMCKTRRMVDVVWMIEQPFCSSFDPCHFSCDSIQDTDISSTSNAALKCVSILNSLLQELILPHHISVCFGWQGLWNNGLKMCKTRRMVHLVYMIAQQICFHWTPATFLGILF